MGGTDGGSFTERGLDLAHDYIGRGDVAIVQGGRGAGGEEVVGQRDRHYPAADLGVGDGRCDGEPADHGVVLRCDDEPVGVGHVAEWPRGPAA